MFFLLIFIVIGILSAYFLQTASFIFLLAASGILIFIFRYDSRRKNFIYAALVFSLIGAANYCYLPFVSLFPSIEYPFIQGMREKLSATANAFLPAPYSALLNSMVFGAKAAELPLNLKDLYKRAGVAHLLVASGMQLGLLVGFFGFFKRIGNFSNSFFLVFASLFNLFYTLIAVPGPSILRSMLMVETMLFAQVFKRENDFVSSFSLSGFLLLLWDPLLLFNAGFQLSFAATWAVVKFSPIIKDYLSEFLPIWLADLSAASLGPVLITLPITWWHFGEVSLIAFISNFFILPWVGLLVIMGTIGAFLGMVIPFLGEIICYANLPLLIALNFLADIFAGFSFSSIAFSPPSLVLVFFYYSLIHVFCYVREKKIKWNYQWSFIILGVFLLLYLVNAFFSASFISGPLLTISMLDVGQGDAILIETPQKKNILVDAGEEKFVRWSVLSPLKRKGICQLDALVLTHAHDDHIGGAPAVLSSLGVAQAWSNGIPANTLSFIQASSLIQSKGIDSYIAQAGDIFYLEPNLYIQILFPDQKSLSLHALDLNNTSLTFRLSYKNFSMLFTGDLGFEGEEQLLAKNFSLKSNILKVGHHGSSTSSSFAFLQRVSPQAALISCGRKNKFRHPHAITLKRLETIKARIFRTDLQGTIKVVTNGRIFNITSCKF